MGALVDVSVNETFSGAVPDVGTAENEATGATGGGVEVVVTGITLTAADGAAISATQTSTKARRDARDIVVTL